MGQQLFEDSEMFMKQRPNFVTEQQKEKWYEQNAREIIANGWSHAEIDDIVCDLKGVLLHDSGGYEIAKHLECNGCGYEIETEFIEFLDGLGWEFDSLKRQNVVAWVKATNPKPKFKVGDRLIYKNKEVLIYGLREETAEYILSDDPKVKGGRLIPYEEVDDVSVIVQ